MARALPARRSRLRRSAVSGGRAVGMLIPTISGPRPPKCLKKHPETHSSNIWRQAAKMLKMMILSVILAISGPSTQHTENDAPETHSGNMWAQAAKMLKMNIRAGKAVRLHTFETPSRGFEEKTQSPTTKSPGGAQMNPGRKAGWASHFLNSLSMISRKTTRGNPRTTKPETK